MKKNTAITLLSATVLLSTAAHGGLIPELVEGVGETTKSAVDTATTPFRDKEEKKNNKKNNGDNNNNNNEENNNEDDNEDSE